MSPLSTKRSPTRLRAWVTPLVTIGVEMLFPARLGFFRSSSSRQSFRKSARPVAGA